MKATSWTFDYRAVTYRLLWDGVMQHWELQKWQVVMFIPIYPEWITRQDRQIKEICWIWEETLPTVDFKDYLDAVLPGVQIERPLRPY